MFFREYMSEFLCFESQDRESIDLHLRIYLITLQYIVLVMYFSNSLIEESSIYSQI